MKNVPYQIAIWASGQGTNAEKIMAHFTHHTCIKIGLLVTSHPEAPVIEKAKKKKIATWIIRHDELNDEQTMLSGLQKHHITHIVLAGFIWLIPASMLYHYQKKIINIHPSLLPYYGGKGMYGINVHRAVKKAGETKTGITIHEVNEQYDEGTIVFQTSCTVFPKDTVDDIAMKVRCLEHQYYPQIIEQWMLKKSIAF